MARKNTPSTYTCSICSVTGHNARTCPSKSAGTKSATQIVKEMRAAKRLIREARKAAKIAAKAVEAPVSEEVTIDPLLLEIEQDERERDAADLEAAIAATTVVEEEPAEKEQEIMGLTADPDILSILRSLGIDTSSVEG